MDERMKSAVKEAAKLLLDGKVRDRKALRNLKRFLGQKYRLEGVMRNSDILEVIPPEKRRKEVVWILRKRPMRTISGIAPVAIMCNADCPHGRCAYCPRGEMAAQSYTGREPAAMRAIQNDYDPYRQTKARIKQLEAIGHPTEKCELIIMGGTFNAQPAEYQRWFVKRALDAMNGYTSSSLEEAQEFNEKARHRVVGITFETRPDWCEEHQIDLLLSMGATRVEIGVQTLKDDVYDRVGRGHKLKDVVKATERLRNSGLKVCYHMMPGLLSTPDEDVEMFRILFEDDRFRPDMLKIYPFLVLKGTETYEWWKKGRIHPYSDKEAARVIARATRYIPEWCRVMRIQRDIPAGLIVDGVRKSNLRQLVDEERRGMGVLCRCIRCRELGLKLIKKGIRPNLEDVELRRVDYEASGGKEVFLSFNEMEHDAIIGFIRLRIPQTSHRKEIDSSSALIRELHVYGGALGLGEMASIMAELQHRKFGERLLKEAEVVAKEEFGKEKMVITSGVGVREYYRKHGYHREGPYMCKAL